MSNIEESSSLDALSTADYNLVQHIPSDDGDCEPPQFKRARYEVCQITLPETPAMSIKELLAEMNRTLSERLQGIECRLESIDNRTRYLESKVEQFVQHLSTTASDQSPYSGVCRNGSSKAGPYPSTRTSSGAIVIGVPHEKSSLDEGYTEHSIIQDMSAGLVDRNVPVDGLVQKIGPNVTLITLNTEDDFPEGTWLGDEGNLSMRVRVNVSPSDLLHIHSNCRTPEKMALALLDYLFDRDTQASSNLSGLGKHGKKQLDPLLIYGIRCHLIQKFSITDEDWRKLKNNIDSKCRTAYRRKVRGMPLTVKAFRGKSMSTYVQSASSPMGDAKLYEDIPPGSDDDDSFQQDESKLHVQEVIGSSSSLLQGVSGGHYQFLQATPEQMAELQQTHQIQILESDQILHLQQAIQDGHDGVLTLTSNGLHVVRVSDDNVGHMKEENDVGGYEDLNQNNLTSQTVDY